MDKQKTHIKYTAPKIGFWDIPGVTYRGETGTYRFFEKTTFPMTQEKLAERYCIEKPKGNPHAIDSILTYAIFEATHNLKEQNPDEVKNLRQFLLNSLPRFQGTLTRVTGIPSEKEKIIHNYNTPDEYSLEEDIAGCHFWIKEKGTQNKKVLEAFLGTQDIDKISKVFQWVNEKGGYVERWGSKHGNIVDFGIVGFLTFSTYPNGLLLDCERYSPREICAFQALKVD